MPTRRREPPSPALDALRGAEYATVLAELLASHPDLRPEAEQVAQGLLGAVADEAVADDVAWALEAIPLEDLAARAGRVRGRGYVHESEAAAELIGEVIEPVLTDLSRRAGLGLMDAAAAIVTGIVAGVYQAREPVDGTVVAYAGPDALTELADEVINEAIKLGVALPPDAADRYWPEWSSLG